MSGPLLLHAEDGRLRILLIDNFDSYSYNLYHGLAKAGCEVPSASLALMQWARPDLQVGPACVCCAPRRHPSPPNGPCR